MAMHISAIPHDGRSSPADASLLGAYSLAILGWFLSAGVYIAARWATSEMPPWALTFWRLALAAAILVPIVRQHYQAMVKLVSARPIQLVVTGGLGFTICQGLLYTALHYTDATTAGLIMALCPVITMILAHFLLGEALGAWQWLGAAVSLLGMVVIVAHGDLAALLRLQLNPGEPLILVGAVAFAFYTVLLKHFKFGIERLPLLVLLLGAGAIAAAPFYGLELMWDERTTLDSKGLLALAYVAAPGGAFMYYLYNRSVDTLGAGRAGMLMYLQAAFVALLAYLLLGESLHAYHLAGAAIIVAGLVPAVLIKPKAAGAAPARGG